MAKMRKPMGRPPLPNGHSCNLSLSCSKVEHYEAKKQAAEAGLSVSKYLRRKLGLDEEVTGGAKNARLHQ